MKTDIELDNSKELTSLKFFKYQSRFLGQISAIANEIFSKLDDKINPKIFLLAIPKNGKKTNPLISLEPPDESGYLPENFSQIFEVARVIDQEIAANDPFRKFKPYKAPKEVYKLPLKLAVERIVSELSKDAGLITYCSDPITVEKHLVCCVLQFDKSVFESHFSLKVRYSQSWRFPSCLIDSTAIEFLLACSKALKHKYPGTELKPLGEEPERILRFGAKELIFRAAESGGGPMPNLFETLDILSSKNYEGAKASGEILIITPTHPDLTKDIVFNPGIELSDHGAARKVLEMANESNSSNTGEKLYLLSTGHIIYGIGRLKSNYHKQYSEVYKVRFVSHFSWEMEYDGHPML